MNSVRLSIRISTRSPNATPRLLSAPARAATRSSSSRHVVVRPRKRRAVASGCISECRAGWFVQFCRRARNGCSVASGIKGEVNSECSWLARLLHLIKHGVAPVTVWPRPLGYNPTPDGPESPVNAPPRARSRPRRAVRREQLSDEVAARLRIDIMTGTLRPGTFIRLDDTAAQLGVSITPVREALRTLRGEGMVQLEPHRGHVVVPLTRSDVEDIFWLQGTIAKELAATAAEQITPAEIDELEHLNDALAAAVDGHDLDEIASAEFAFHRTLNRSTGRIKLAWFLLHVARYLPGQIYTGDPQ